MLVHFLGFEAKYYGISRGNMTRTINLPPEERVLDELAGVELARRRVDQWCENNLEKVRTSVSRNKKGTSKSLKPQTKNIMGDFAAEFVVDGLAKLAGDKISGSPTGVSGKNVKTTRQIQEQHQFQIL